MDFEYIDTDPNYALRMKHISDALTANHDLSNQVSRWMGELTYFSWVDPTDGDDENRVAYLTKDEERQQRIRAIGEEINQMGGIGLMQFVHAATAQMMKGPSDPRTLEFAWHGIGEWRC